MKRLNAKSTYRIVKEGETYVVVLSHLKNNASGCPRFEAEIINVTDNYLSLAHCYRFNGHYCGEHGEAEWAVDRYVDDCKK